MVEVTGDAAELPAEEVAEVELEDDEEEAVTEFNGDVT